MTNEEAREVLGDVRAYLASRASLENEMLAGHTFTNICNAIKALERQPKTGHWICHREHCENLGVIPSGLGAYEWCSNCDCGIDVTEFHMNHYNYCPNCGAKMEVDE